jgi:D-amino peptidase
MKIFIFTDLEGCAGIFHRELQITNPTPQEFARTLRLCTRQFVAAIEGAWAGGAKEILVHAGHDIDIEMLPTGVEVLRGMTWGWVDFLEKGFDAMVIVGMHGGAHLLDCALAHSFLPSWQIEQSSGFQEGWMRQIAPQVGEVRPGEFSTVEKLWLNGRLCGEGSVIMAQASGFGVPTACICGCIHACQEAKELVSEVETVPVKWCIHFRAARMLSPAAAEEAIRGGVEQALKRFHEIPVIPDGPQEIKIRYVHPERAERAARWPGTRREDDRTVAATAPSERDIPGLRFLFARPESAYAGPTAEEQYQPPEWLEL